MPPFQGCRLLQREAMHAVKLICLVVNSKVSHEFVFFILTTTYAHVFTGGIPFAETWSVGGMDFQAAGHLDFIQPYHPVVFFSRIDEPVQHIINDVHC